jgi:hypothetical protein
MSDDVKYVTLDFEGSVELTESEVWPDGDAPAGWTADHVRERIEASDGLLPLLRDWNLADYIEVTVTDDEGDTAHPWSGLP